MATIRPLLVQGNGKLGEAIHHFDLPAVTTCPGRSRLCQGVCYAMAGRFGTKPVRDRLRWCLRQSRRDDFPDRMVAEVRRKGAVVVRVHVSGDFYDAGYAVKWRMVFRRCPTTRFYFYTRSWRVAEVELVLAEMATFDNVRAWYSADAETGMPDPLPSGVRVAWLQTEADDTPEGELVFRIRRLRKAARMSLPVVCPYEVRSDPAPRVNCGSCGRCWQ